MPEYIIDAEETTTTDEWYRVLCGIIIITLPLIILSISNFHEQSPHLIYGTGPLPTVMAIMFGLSIFLSYKQTSCKSGKCSKIAFTILLIMLAIYMVINAMLLLSPDSKVVMVLACILSVGALIASVFSVFNKDVTMMPIFTFFLGTVVSFLTFI